MTMMAVAAVLPAAAEMMTTEADAVIRLSPRLMEAAEIRRTAAVTAADPTAAVAEEVIPTISLLRPSVEAVLIRSFRMVCRTPGAVPISPLLCLSLSQSQRC